MALLADFYVSTDANALTYDLEQTVPDIDRAQHTSITPLELSTLLAIMQGQEWDVDMMDEFTCLIERDGGERLIHRLPAALVSQLASVDQIELQRTIAAWAQTEELECKPSEIQPVVEDLVRLSRR